MDETGDWGFEADEIRPASEGRVVVTGRFLLRRDRSGADVEQHMCAVLTMQGGKIVRTESFSSGKEALEAAGLSE